MGNNNTTPDYSSRIAAAIAKAPELQSVKEKIQRDGQFKHRIMESLALSFTGSKDSEPDLLLDWVVGKKLGDREKHLNERNKMGYFILYLPLACYCLYPKYGDTLHLVDESGALTTVQTKNTNLHSTDEPHPVSSSFVVLRFYPHGYGGRSYSEKYLWEPMAAIQQKLTFPSRYAPSWGNIFSSFARADVLSKVMEAKHHKFLDSTPHIFVGLVSVSPEAQGMGACSKLMRGINKIADDLGWACYLEEGGDRRKAIYERYGYQVVSGPHTLNHRDESYDGLNMMMRPAKK
eukprot:TRINITY_DN413_c0_g1_i1.p1 TRINITY_DN413_c0_g1~~TRINITY_DN413_c0_g1_i1.p1  ORF type:complete len:290 (+),score=37.73 TRINITY_DN413_c0_g1_i1:50-919(+)